MGPVRAGRPRAFQLQEAYSHNTPTTAFAIPIRAFTRWALFPASRTRRSACYQWLRCRSPRQTWPARAGITPIASTWRAARHASVCRALWATRAPRPAVPRSRRASCSYSGAECRSRLPSRKCSIKRTATPQSSQTQWVRCRRSSIAFFSWSLDTFFLALTSPTLHRIVVLFHWDTCIECEVKILSYYCNELLCFRNSSLKLCAID